MTDNRITRDTISLTLDEVRRYSRHLIMPEVGINGQRRLKASRVLLVGAGGLGSPVALYLAAAGIGHIGLVDHDAVDASNLQRQIIHGTSSIGRSKLESARERMLDLNPHITVNCYPAPLTSANAFEVLAPYDVVVDGTDNFPTRYLINDACVLLGKPNVYGSIFRFEGQVSVFDAHRGPCYRCLFPVPPPPGLVPSCADGGVLGVLPGTIGAIQATETIKILLGIGDSLIGRLLLYDALTMSFDLIKLHKDPGCPVCGKQPTLTELIDYEAFCGAPVLTEVGAPANADSQTPAITVREVADRLNRGEVIALLDVREPHEWQISDLRAATHHIPMGQILDHLDEFDRDREIVVYCRTGVRSAKVTRLLHAHGFSRARNMSGGINAWAAEIDTSLPIY